MWVCLVSVVLFIVKVGKLMMDSSVVLVFLDLDLCGSSVVSVLCVWVMLLFIISIGGMLLE